MKRNRNRAGGSRKSRQVVVLECELEQDAWQNLYRIGREREWTLLDLRFSGDVVPAGLNPIGAFVRRLPTDPFVKRLLKMGCHVIRLGDAPHPLDDIVPAVLPAKHTAGRRAADHFANRGFRHVGFVAHDPWGSNETLYQGLRDRAAKLNCQCHLLQWTSMDNRSKESVYAERQKMFAEWLECIPGPIGVLGPSDERSALFTRMCADAGVDVPGEVGLLGLGNSISICETIYPTLSSIVFDPEQTAYAAVDILDRLVAGKKVPDGPFMIPPDGIVTRQSTDVLAAPDPKIAAALRFIWENYEKDISLNDIVEASGLVRRTFTGRFRQIVGRSPIEVLRDKRLYEARNLLRMTELPVADIAPKVGFASVENFHRTFRRIFEITPKQFRKGREPLLVSRPHGL